MKAHGGINTIRCHFLFCSTSAQQGARKWMPKGESPAKGGGVIACATRMGTYAVLLIPPSSPSLYCSFYVRFELVSFLEQKPFFL